jgi:signal transduction histidine kinase
MTYADDQDEFSQLFAPEPDTAESRSAEDDSNWKVLLVDDEQDIHAMFRLAIQNMGVEKLSLRLLEASTAEEAKTILNEHPDLALVLLDVVMETEQAGLELVRYIRQKLNNRLVQIVLITGQPGYAPERQVVIDYDINGYRLKSELSADKIFVSVYTAIRTYNGLLCIVQHQFLLMMLLQDNQAKTRIAETANKAKGNFLINMSHEIRTPLNTILGMTQMLSSIGNNSEKQQECARAILASGKALLTIISDVLDLCETEADRYEPNETVVDVTQFLGETMLLFSEQAHKKNLTITSNWLGPIHRSYLLDSVRIRKMLSNLVSNAIKFTLEGSVAVEVSELKTVGKLAQLEFSVSDSGIGIDKHQQAFLFQPFTQLDSNLNRQYQGVGLGLALVKRFADLMKGEVGLSSELNQGSRFWFRVTCPIAEVPKTFPETKPLDYAESIESVQLETVCLEKLNAMEPSADFESLLDELGQSLAQNLFSSITKAQKLQETLEGYAIGKRFSELFMLIHELRFEEAYNQLQQIRRELSKKI